MTSKVAPGGPVELDAEAALIDAASADEIKTSAEAYRVSKDAAPEVAAAGKAAQLQQACADLAYYTQLAQERTRLIKQLTAELDDGQDADLSAITSRINKR